MGTKHKHYDVIVAWAAGEEIQYFWGFQWRDWEETSCPAFTGTAEWRIKPKRVKKEGWVNAYETGYGNLFPTKEQADNCGSRWRTACIRIEWEEEE
jgi:hypothetical protein